jgi:hypothetical protein
MHVAGAAANGANPMADYLSGRFKSADFRKSL